MLVTACEAMLKEVLGTRVEQVEPMFTAEHYPRPSQPQPKCFNQSASTDHLSSGPEEQPYEGHPSNGL